MARKGGDLRKKVEEMIAAAQAQGFRTEATQSGVKVFAKDKTKGLVIVHLTPSDIRAIQNAKSRLRGIGVEL